MGLALELPPSSPWLSVSVHQLGSGSVRVWNLSTLFTNTNYLSVCQYVLTSGRACSPSSNYDQVDVARAVAFGSGSAGEWWLRAPAFRDSGQDRFVESFFDVTTSGKFSSSYRASVALKVAFGFCIRRFLNL